MPTMKVKIKHAGKTHEDLELNTDAPPTAFKQLVYERTGVPLDRMKIMVKGGVLKVSSPLEGSEELTDFSKLCVGRLRLEEGSTQRGSSSVFVNVISMCTGNIGSPFERAAGSSTGLWNMAPRPLWRACVSFIKCICTTSDSC